MDCLGKSGLAVLVFDAPQREAGGNGEDAVDDEVDPEKEAKQDHSPHERVGHDQDGEDDGEQPHDEKQPAVRVRLLGHGDEYVHKTDHEQDHGDDDGQDRGEELGGKYGSDTDDKPQDGSEQEQCRAAGCSGKT
jgi:hypothetical protein